MTDPSQARRGESERMVIRDKRKINATGERGKHQAGHTPKHSAEAVAPDESPEVPAAESPTLAAEPEEAPATAPPGSGSGAAEPGNGGLGGGAFGAELEQLRTALEERTRDLQRVTAEYANYRKRMDRDRALISEQATGKLLSAILPILDDLDRAREHGELAEGVAAVVDKLVDTTAKFGLTPFGERGDPFDPTRHEAVAHLTSAEVDQPTCVDVLRRGYLHGDRLLRPAMVAVADPSESS